jgi:serine protease inhibitor ecotin
LTQDQVSGENFLAWLDGRLQLDCPQIELGGSLQEQFDECKLDLLDVLHVLRTAPTVQGRYVGGCFVVRGADLSGRRISVVVAPPSDKDRVRVVKVWLGD